VFRPSVHDDNTTACNDAKIIADDDEGENEQNSSVAMKGDSNNIRNRRKTKFSVSFNNNTSSSSLSSLSSDLPLKKNAVIIPPPPATVLALPPTTTRRCCVEEVVDVSDDEYAEDVHIISFKKDCCIDNSRPSSKANNVVVRTCVERPAEDNMTASRKTTQERTLRRSLLLHPKQQLQTHARVSSTVMMTMTPPPSFSSVPRASFPSRRRSWSSEKWVDHNHYNSYNKAPAVLLPHEQQQHIREVVMETSSSPPRQLFHRRR
jgi:hypothetical protein